MLRQINFRIDTDLVQRLDVRAKEMSLDRSAIIKQLSASCSAPI